MSPAVKLGIKLFLDQELERAECEKKIKEGSEALSGSTVNRQYVGPEPGFLSDLPATTRAASTVFGGKHSESGALSSGTAALGDLLLAGDLTRDLGTLGRDEGYGCGLRRSPSWWTGI
jgi:hypothetical protein